MLDPNTADERVLGEGSQCGGTTCQQQKTWTGLGDSAHTVHFEHVAGSRNGIG